MSKNKKKLFLQLVRLHWNGYCGKNSHLRKWDTNLRQVVHKNENLHSWCHFLQFLVGIFYKVIKMNYDDAVCMECSIIILCHVRVVGSCCFKEFHFFFQKKKKNPLKFKKQDRSGKKDRLLRVTIVIMPLRMKNLNEDESKKKSFFSLSSL